MKSPTKKQFLKEMTHTINNANFLVTKEENNKIVIVGKIKKKS